MAPCAISWSDMLSYFRLMRHRPSRWEINILRELDKIALAAQAAKAPAKDRK